MVHHASPGFFFGVPRLWMPLKETCQCSFLDLKKRQFWREAGLTPSTQPPHPTANKKKVTNPKTYIWYIYIYTYYTGYLPCFIKFLTAYFDHLGMWRLENTIGCSIFYCHSSSRPWTQVVGNCFLFAISPVFSETTPAIPGVRMKWWKFLCVGYVYQRYLAMNVF